MEEKLTMWPFLRAHAGQDGLGQGDQPEDVGLEHRADLVVFAFLNGGKVTVTSVIDQYVDATELFFRGFNGAGDRILVVNVERQGESMVLMFCNDGSHLFRDARGDYGAPAAAENLPCDFAAETGGAAR
jgi:hypothetical protein